MAAAQCLCHERPGNSSALVLWMNNERCNGDLVGFIVRPDARGSNERFTLERTKEEQIGGLNLFGCLFSRVVVQQLKKHGLLRVSQPEHRVDRPRNALVSVIERGYAMHVLNAP